MYDKGDLEIKSKDDKDGSIISKINDCFFTYNIAMKLFSLGEDVDELISALDDSFDVYLAILARDGITEKYLKKYKDRRSKIIKSYVNSKR